MTRTYKPAMTIASLSVAVALVLGGCSGSSGGSKGSASTSAGAATSASGGGTTLKIGVSPTISSVDVLYAVRAGLFTKAGLHVTTSTDTTSGAATFPELVNGQLDFTVVDPMSPILAVSKGLPLQIAALGNVMASDPSKNFVGIMVKPGSGITRAADLEGKTVALNSLDSVLQLLTQITVDAAGGDSSKVKFVEVPPLNEVNAVAHNQVNAFANVEPLLTSGKAAGLTILAHPPASIGGLPQDVIATSKSFASKNPTTVATFQKVMAQANAALAANPKLIVSTAIAQKEVPAAVATKIILPVFSSAGAVSASSLTKLQALMIKYKYLKTPVAATTLLGGS